MIIGKFITLGPITSADIPALFLWENDFEISRINHTYRPATWRNIEEHWLNVGSDSSRVYFGIRKLKCATLIGYVQITAIDAINRSATLGIRIGDAANRDQGFGTEAIKMAIDYCWNSLNLSRIGLTVFENNTGAKNLYIKLGFEIEGTLRRAVFIDGCWLDVHFMGILHPSRVNPTTKVAFNFAKGSDALIQSTKTP